MHKPQTDSNGQASNAWRVLVLLLLANLLNVYDRVIPAVLAESLRREFSLTDVHIGILGTVFTLMYAVAGVPLGLVADRMSRRKLLAAGLAIWSGFTALCGAATGFYGFLMLRVGVGIGEAALAPAATSMISDLFPPEKRSRAMGIYLLGLPLGMVIGFVTVGAIATAFNSWRAAFFVAALPGLLVAALCLRIKEPVRGAAEPLNAVKAVTPSQPIKTLLRIPAFWWIVLSGVGYNFAAYGVVTFLVPLLQRYYKLPLGQAATLGGAIIGGTGLIALSLGGFVADWAQRKNKNGRLLVSAVSLILGAILTWYGLIAETTSEFAWLFGAGWTLAYLYSPCIYPVLQDLVAPQMRATAMGTYFAILYLFGAAFGSVAVGALSDHYADRARLTAGVLELTEAHRATGLHEALVIVPIALLVAAAACWIVTRLPRHGGQDLE